MVPATSSCEFEYGWLAEVFFGRTFACVGPPSALASSQTHVLIGDSRLAVGVKMGVNGCGLCLPCDRLPAGPDFTLCVFGKTLLLLLSLHTMKSAACERQCFNADAISLQRVRL